MGDGANQLKFLTNVICFFSLRGPRSTFGTVPMTYDRSKVGGSLFESRSSINFLDGSYDQSKVGGRVLSRVVGVGGTIV